MKQAVNLKTKLKHFIQGNLLMQVALCELCMDKLDKVPLGELDSCLKHHQLAPVGSREVPTAALLSTVLPSFSSWSFLQAKIEALLREDNSLSLQPLDDVKFSANTTTGFSVRAFSQGNLQASRKQVLPLLSALLSKL